MKNHFRFLVLAVALFVLCAPLSAMADDYQSATIILRNPTIVMGENQLTIEAGVQLDIGANAETGAITATLAALAQDQQAIKGGLIFDPASMKLIAGLEGMTNGVVIPLDEMMQALEAQLSQMLPGGGTAAIENLFAAYMNLINAAQNSEAAGAIQQAIMAWLAEHFPEDGNKGEVTIEVRGVTLTAQQYDFSFTLADVLDLSAAICEITKNDAELAAALQAYMDAYCDVFGMEHIDISAIDPKEAFAEAMEDVSVTFDGSLYTADQGGVLDLAITVAEDDEAETLLVCGTVLPADEGVMSASITLSADEDTIDMEALIPVDGTPAFSFSVNGIAEGMEVKYNFTVNAVDGLVVSLYGEVTSSFNYDGQEYKSLNAFGVNYAGTMEAAENGVSFPGYLTLYVNNEGQEITISAETLLSLNAANTAVFEAPHNLIDITKADEETMGSLMNEFMAALQNGLAVMMSVPGIAAMMGGAAA